MYAGQKIVVVLPAYNAAKTIQKTYQEIPLTLVDEVILCDDASVDDTLTIAQKLGIDHVLAHDVNLGYGANQKSLYRAALVAEAQIVVMLHPDYQYDPKLIPAMVSMLAQGHCDVVLGSRILGKGALKGGMPLYKYIANRFLTLIQNILSGYKLSEYHTGFRAYKRVVLEQIRFEDNSDDFIFDNEILAQVIYAGFSIGEISCPAKYFAEASSINFTRSVKYGLGVLRVSMAHFLQRHRIAQFSLFK